MAIFVFVSYRNRYWNEAYFGAIQLIHNSLKKTYGTHQDGSLKVSLVDAAIRWLKWHSKLSAEQGGILLHSLQAWSDGIFKRKNLSMISSIFSHCFDFLYLNF